MRTMVWVAAAMMGVGAGVAGAQDAGMMASQAAMQASSMAMQQTNDAAMMANQQAMQNAQIAAMDFPVCQLPMPKISLKPGSYAGAQTVTLTDRAKHADVYYSLHGWTPTAKSHKYTGPISVSASTQLRAVAYQKGCGRSFVAKADYVVAGTAAAEPVTVADGVLRQGTTIPLEFTHAVDSKSVKLGQTVELRLAAPIVVGARTILPADARAQATVISVDSANRFGHIPSVSFKVDALYVDGVAVPLDAEVTQSGDIMRQLFITPKPATVQADQMLVATVTQDSTLVGK